MYPVNFPEKKLKTELNWYHPSHHPTNTVIALAKFELALHNPTTKPFIHIQKATRKCMQKEK